MSNGLVQYLKLALAPPLWRLLVAGVRLQPGAAPAPADGRAVIYACLHRDIIPAILYVQPRRPALLVSDSPDGEILIRTLGNHGFRFVRGSTGKDGKRAFVRLLGYLREGVSIGLAVDGPRGPFGTIRDGVIQLSRRSGCAIVPLRARPGRHRVLGTWDRTVLPWPFSPVRIETGCPLQVRPEAGVESATIWRQKLTEYLLPERVDLTVGSEAAGSEAAGSASAPPPPAPEAPEKRFQVSQEERKCGP